MKRIENGFLEEKEEIAENLLYMKINLPGIAAGASPGNFITILPPAASGRFLRRPFSIAGTSGSSIELIIKGTGDVTKSFFALEKGAVIDAMGPLGNCYEIKEKNIWMIGGGTGIASLLFLNSWRENHRRGMTGKDRQNSTDKVLWAGKTASQIPSHAVLGRPEYSRIFRDNVFLATDDGSAGERGTAAEVLGQWIESRRSSGSAGEITPLPCAIVACGPHAMMKGVREAAEKAGIPSWFSLEEFMACGTGACAGCAVPAAGGGYLKACDDGPVFEGKRIIL